MSGGSMSRTLGRWSLAVLLATGAIGANPTLAAKLIYMNNGRVLKADTTTDDGEWLHATLAGGNEIAFPSTAVAKVEEDPFGDQPQETHLNVVTSGRDLGGRGAPTPRNQGVANPLTEAQQKTDAPAASRRVVTPGGVAGRAGGPQVAQPGNQSQQPVRPPNLRSGGLRSRGRSKLDKDN